MIDCPKFKNWLDKKGNNEAKVEADMKGIPYHPDHGKGERRLNMADGNEEKVEADVILL
jgi:hypothetical protein